MYSGITTESIKTHLIQHYSKKLDFNGVRINSCTITPTFFNKALGLNVPEIETANKVVAIPYLRRIKFYTVPQNKERD